MWSKKKNTRASNTVKTIQTDSDLTIAAIVAILKQRRRIIFLTTAVLFLLVALYCVTATPHYKSTAVIELQGNSTDLIGLESLLAAQPGETGDALNASLDLQTQVEILQSDTLALKVINDLNLEKTRDFEPHWSPVGAVLEVFSSKESTDPASASLEDAPGRRSYVTKVLSNHLKVKTVAGTRLIEISYADSDPRIAAAVVNDLTRALMDYGFTTRNSATNQTSEWLGSQLSDLKRQARDLQARVVALQRYTGIYSLGEDSQGRDQVYSSTLDQLQQATNALTAATSNRIMKGALYETIRNGDPDMISGLAGSGPAASAPAQNSFALLQSLRTQQAAAAAQLAQDNSKFGQEYPKLADERSNLASLDKSIAAEIRRIGERAKNDYETASGAEDKLLGVYNERKVQAEKLNDKAIEYVIAKQEADNSRALYEDLSKRLKEAGVIEGLRSSNISVVSPARVSAKPSSPNVPLYLAGAIVLGLFLGTCGALYSDMTDDTIQSFTAMERSLGMSLTAVLPSLQRSYRKLLLGLPGVRRFARRPDESVSPLVVLDEPVSAFTEALRRLRMSILSSRIAPIPRVILVTSSVPGEGKTTVAGNLAVLLAQAGKSVLFVDGDLRQHEQSRFVDPSGGSVRGFSQLLSHREQAMETNKVPRCARMQMIPAGPATQYPTELLSSDRCRELLNQWKDSFDYVVLDSPSVLDVTDALILAQWADMTLLVARYGFTTSKALGRAYDLLASGSDTNVGVILNGVDRNSVSYADYFGYAGSTYYETT
jgi:succinoglycan biosynthesis transport protein ExoP